MHSGMLVCLQKSSTVQWEIIQFYLNCGKNDLVTRNILLFSSVHVRPIQLTGQQNF